VPLLSSSFACSKSFVVFLPISYKIYSTPRCMGSFRNGKRAKLYCSTEFEVTIPLLPIFKNVAN